MVLQEGFGRNKTPPSPLLITMIATKMINDERVKTYEISKNLGIRENIGNNLK